jgi:hypothetical protein
MRNSTLPKMDRTKMDLPILDLQKMERRIDTSTAIRFVVDGGRASTIAHAATSTYLIRIVVDHGGRPLAPGRFRRLRG